MDSFSSSSLSGSSSDSSAPSAESLMDQLKAQVAQAYAEEILEISRHKERRLRMRGPMVKEEEEEHLQSIKDQQLKDEDAPIIKDAKEEDEEDGEDDDDEDAQGDESPDASGSKSSAGVRKRVGKQMLKLGMKPVTGVS